MPSLGRIYTPDPRDEKYLMARTLVGVPTVTKKTWTLRTPRLDQGATGTCVAHGWTNFLRAAPLQTRKGIDKPYDLYRKIVAIDEYPANDSEASAPDSGLQYGTSVRAGAKVLTTEGRLAQYLWAFNLQDALHWVLSNGPVVLGTNWYTGMFSPDSKGFVRIGPGDKLEGGHCFIWRGADRKKGVARFQNSWGTGWGLGGEFLMDFSTLERLILENGEACTATEKVLV